MNDTSACVRCDRQRTIKGRGLCAACYSHAQRDGSLADYPSVYRSSADICEDFEFLRDNTNLTRDEIAVRLNISRAALDQAVCRTRRRRAAA